MGSIVEKLDYLAETKELLRQDLISKGEEVPEDEPFRNYVDRYSKLKVGGVDRLQWKCDNMKTLYYEFGNYAGSNLDILEGLDTSQVTTMSNMCYNCRNLTTIPLLDTSQVTTMDQMFHGCNNLTTIPLLDTSKVTSMSNMFYDCNKLTTIPLLDMSRVTNMGSLFYNCRALTTIPLLDTSNATNMYNMFNGCNNLTTIPLLDMRKVTNMTDTFRNCYKLTNLTLKNISGKTSLQIGSGTSYGTLLTDESLINTAKELWDLTGSTSRTLTVSTPSNARFDAIYVKLIDVTDEMRSEDEYIDNKKPCVVCESTDEGAMTLREYVVSKNWTLA